MMYKQLCLFSLAVLVMTLSSCGGSGPNPPPPDATLIPLATVPVSTNPTNTRIHLVPTQPLPTQPLPTFPPPTTIPTLIPIATQATTPLPTATQVSAAVPTTAPRGLAHVKIFLIAMNDNGKSGPAIGCGDSVIAVQRDIAPTAAPLTAALKELVSLHDQTYGQSGLYNALYQSNLQVNRVAVLNGTAVIQFTGKLMLGGECDDPRVAAQIKSTALQFASVRAVAVFVNGVPLEQLLGGK